VKAAAGAEDYLVRLHWADLRRRREQEFRHRQHAGVTYPNFDDRFQAVLDQFEVYCQAADFGELQSELAVEASVLLRRLKRSCRSILAKSAEVLELARDSVILIREDDALRMLNEMRANDPKFAKQIEHLGPQLTVVNKNAIRLQVLDYSTEDEKHLSDDEREHLYDLVELVTAYYVVAARLLKALQQLPGLKRLDSAPVRNVRNKLLEHHDKADSRVMLNSFGVSENEGPIVKAVRSQDKVGVFLDNGLVPNTTALLDDLGSSLSK